MLGDLWMRVAPGVAVLCGFVGVFGIVRIAREERRRKAMEPPERGELHFLDGPIFGGSYESPDHALSVLNYRVRELCEQRARASRMERK